jgi:hypothetical protein
VTREQAGGEGGPGAGAEIEIGTMAITLDGVPWIDATTLGHHLRARLRRLHLAGGLGGRTIERLSLPPIQARPGEDAALIAMRVARALEKALTQRVAHNRQGDAP